MGSSFLDFLTRWQKRTDAPTADAPRASPFADDAFLAFISHELRTPLSAIVGYSEMLQEDAVFLDQKDLVPDLRKIQKASEHLIALVDDIVDLSRIDAGRMEFTVEEFKPAQVVHEVVRQTRSLVDRTFCTLEADCAPDVGTMHGDRAKVQRGLSNLVRHVVGLSTQGTMKLYVRAEDAGSRRQVLFSLSSSDLVLASEELGSMLQAGTPAGALPQYHGSGLGLVITDRFCRLMGGELQAAALEPKGVMLTMRLPAQP